MLTLSQWQNIWSTLAVPPSNRLNALFTEVVARYNENHRHYHTVQHLGECLEKLAELRHWAENPTEIELALWFHDAIYEPTRQDNEQLSANWAKSGALSMGANPAKAQRIHDLVMVTRHNALPQTLAEKIIVDVDLAILAANPQRFHQYEQQIRQEYAFVPEVVFNSKRKEILQGFLARVTIFCTELFIDRYEQQAQVNLGRAVEKL